MELHEGTRAGVRGGTEQFRWESVKGEVYKDRECYLGHSTVIGVQGRFGKFQKHDWWKKSREEKGVDHKSELDFVKKHEDLLMEEALGLRPAELSKIRGDLSNEQKIAILGTSEQTSRDTSKEELGLSKKEIAKIKKAAEKARKKEQRRKEKEEKKENKLRK